MNVGNKVACIKNYTHKYSGTTWKYTEGKLYEITVVDEEVFYILCDPESGIQVHQSGNGLYITPKRFRQHFLTLQESRDRKLHLLI